MLASFVMGITAVIFLTAIVEAIMPDEKFKKYVKLAMGLFMILTVLKPLTGINGIAENIENMSFTYKSVGEDSEIINEIITHQKEQVAQTFRQKLESEIETDIQNAFKIQSAVKVTLNGETPAHADITIADLTASEGISALVAEKYSVTINVQKG